nr:MAG TPA: hypothetical protein [Caudoviricetes sp.]
MYIASIYYIIKSSNETAAATRQLGEKTGPARREGRKEK